MDSGDSSLVRRPVRYRYSLEQLLALRYATSASQPLEWPSQAMRFLSQPVRNTSDRNPERPPQPGPAPAVASERQPFKSAVASAGANSAPVRTEASTSPPVQSSSSGLLGEFAPQGSLLGMPSHLRMHKGEKPARSKTQEEEPDVEEPPPPPGELLTASKAVDHLGDEPKPVVKPPPPPPPPVQQPSSFPWAAEHRMNLPPPPGWQQLPNPDPMMGFSFAPHPSQRLMNEYSDPFRVDRGGPPGHQGMPDYYHPPQGGNEWGENDPWDSPAEGGDVNDIFTLGDIRQAEHTIESQGISAESYANFRTRKILQSNQQRRAEQTSAFPAKGMSPDIFFGDTNQPGDKQESRFLSMFENNGGNVGGHVDVRQQQQQPPQRNNRDLQNQAVAMLQNLPYAQQQQLAANWVASQTDKSASERALMREHLLRILGLHNRQGDMTATPKEAQFGQMPKPKAAPGYPSRGVTYSKPLNPAAPNFAPSGLFNMTDKRGAVPPPPARPAYQDSPHHFYPPQQQAWGPPQRADDYGVPPAAAYQQPPPPQQQAPHVPADIADMLQKLVARHKQHQQQNLTDQQSAQAAAQLIQRQLLLTGNLTPEQINNVVAFLKANKNQSISAMAASQQHARKKERSAADPASSAALLQQAAAHLRQQGYAQQAAQPPGMSPPAAVTPFGQQQTQVGASPPANARGGAATSLQTQKTVASLLNTLNKIHQQHQMRQGAPQAAAAAVNPGQQTPSKQQQIFLSTCIDHIQSMAHRLKNQNAPPPPGGSGGAPPPQPRAGPPPRMTAAGPPPYANSNSLKISSVLRDAAAPAGDAPLPPPRTAAESAAALSMILRQLPASHPVHAQVAGLIQQQRAQQQGHIAPSSDPVDSNKENGEKPVLEPTDESAAGTVSSPTTAELKAESHNPPPYEEHITPECQEGL